MSQWTFLLEGCKKATSFEARNNSQKGIRLFLKLFPLVSCKITVDYYNIKNYSRNGSTFAFAQCERTLFLSTIIETEYVKTGTVINH